MENRLIDAILLILVLSLSVGSYRLKSNRFQKTHEF